jgi:DNA-binding NarL/FixJ family response regulator
MVWQSGRRRRGCLSTEGISRILEDEEDIEIVATCSDFDSLRLTVGDVRPDVVLTDIRMPPTRTDEGIRLAAELRGTHPGVGVVILSQYAEPLYAIKLLDGGSDRRAYLPKDADSSRAGDSCAGRGGLEQPGDRRARCDHQARPRAAHQLDLRKLELGDPQNISRRVKAALLYLAGQVE